MVSHERLYIPGDRREDLVDRHVRRYEVVKSLINNRDCVVCDYGCGSGYGSKILAARARTVIGYDPNSDAISFAMIHNSSPNIYFTDNDTDVFMNSYDLVCMVDVLEHLTQPQVVEVLEHIHLVLKNNGVLVITTPERRKSGKIRNVHHLHEYSRKELMGLLSTFFTDIRLETGTTFNISKIGGRQENLIAICRKA